MNLRFARHTNKLTEITTFYTEIIGLDVIGKFENHNGYDGVFLGKENLNWHLEFTTSNEMADHTFDEDDLLVFYPENSNIYNSILNKIETNRIEIHSAKNPYWKQNGILIKDPDGFGIIISHLKTITNSAKNQ